MTTIGNTNLDERIAATRTDVDELPSASRRRATASPPGTTSTADAASSGSSRTLSTPSKSSRRPCCVSSGPSPATPTIAPSARTSTTSKGSWLDGESRWTPKSRMRVGCLRTMRSSRTRRSVPPCQRPSVDVSAARPGGRCSSRHRRFNAPSVGHGWSTRRPVGGADRRGPFGPWRNGTGAIARPRRRGRCRRRRWGRCR